MKPSKSSFGEAAAAFLSLTATGLGMLTGQGAHAAESVQEFYTAQDFNDRQCRFIVLDGFKNGESSHGHMVSTAAESVGVEKDVVQIQLDQSKIRLAGIKATTTDSVAMAKADQDPTEFGASLQRVIEEKAVTHYSIMSTEVEALTDAGYTNSVANFSQGTDEAATVEGLFNLSRLAWTAKKPSSVEHGIRLTQNYANFFGLDSEAILHVDPNINGPARQKFQQALIDHVHQLFSESDEVAQARQRWTDAVRDFEAGNNSVVIAAGNSAGLEEKLESLNGGHDLTVPSTFYNNLLEIEEVTSVGAITPVLLEDREEPIEIVAVYNSPSNGIDVYADGGVSHNGRRAAGTSFSAPKVGAAMTNTHCENPSFNSQQVEAYIADHHTRDLSPYGKGLTVLNTESLVRN